MHGCDGGQLAVAIASEVAPMERDDGSGVAMIGKGPGLAGRVEHGEIDCH
jgi:hypothetical protein